MAYIKMIWAVFLGTVVGIILGIVFDWAMQNGYVLEKGAEYAALFPWVAGGGALFGAIMAVMVLGPNLVSSTGTTEKSSGGVSGSANAAKVKPSRKPARTKPVPAARGKKPNPKDQDYVEGMPSFDFNAASKEIPAEPMPKGKGKK